MAAPGYFPLLVEGSWGTDPPKSLITKLQLYFQSQKRSGGGECEVRQEPGSPARFLVLFHPLDGEGRRGGGERRPWGSPCGDTWTGARSGTGSSSSSWRWAGCRMDQKCAGSLSSSAPRF